MKVVIRLQSTKYSEILVGRDKFQEVFNNISVQRRILNIFQPDNDMMNLLNARETRMIHLCDVKNESGTQYDAQQFTLSKRWSVHQLARGQRVTFSANIYRLTKLKSKNGQKPGPDEISELRYPDDIQHTQRRDKTRLRPRVKDHTIDYRVPEDEDTILQRLIDEQVEDLLAEHNYPAASASRDAQKGVRRGGMQKR